MFLPLADHNKGVILATDLADVPSELATIKELGETLKTRLKTVSVNSRVASLQDQIARSTGPVAKEAAQVSVLTAQMLTEINGLFLCPVDFCVASRSCVLWISVSLLVPLIPVHPPSHRELHLHGNAAQADRAIQRRRCPLDLQL